MERLSLQIDALSSKPEPRVSAHMQVLCQVWVAPYNYLYHQSLMSTIFMDWPTQDLAEIYSFMDQEV